MLNLIHRCRERGAELDALAAATGNPILMFAQAQEKPSTPEDIWDFTLPYQERPSEIYSTRIEMRSSRQQQRVPKVGFQSFSRRVWSPLSKEDPAWLFTECGGGGDCFFHSVGVALGLPQSKIRQLASSVIDESSVDTILQYYTEVYPQGNWDRAEISAAPSVSERVQRLRAVVETTGGTYMGDDTTMKLLTLHKKVRLGFVVFHADGSVYPHVFVNRYTKQLIVLLHRSNHWQLIGYRVTAVDGDDVQVQFNPWRLPAFLGDALAKVNVHMVRDFATWSPRLELEQKSS